MRTHWHALLSALILGTMAGLAQAQPPGWTPPDPKTAPVEPGNHAVLLPPQMFDDNIKVPNTTREKRGEWTIFAGVYLIQPVFNTNPAFVVHRPGGVSRQVDFSHHLDAAPQIWLGYVSERGWGVRGRWWQFDHASSAGYTTEPGETVRGISGVPLGQAAIPANVAASSSLRVDVGDLQVSYSCESAKWSLLTAFGVRYTRLSQDYRATLQNGATRIDAASWHGIDGAGPSFSLEAKRKIGETGFALYGNLHAAVVFGQNNEAYTAINNGVYQEFNRANMDILPIGELEVGGEYSRTMGRARLFVQTGFVGQIWWHGGNASNLDPIGNASASHSNFGFIGVALRAGVRY